MKPAALITGGAVRVGKSIALYLAEQGHDIALHYNTSRNEADATAAEIKKTGVSCNVYQADLSDPVSHKTLIHSVGKDFPRFAVLVNSASVFERGPFMESNRTVFDKAFALNLAAPVFLTQAFAAEVGKGCVVNMLDTAISRDDHAYFFYLMSKKSLHDFTRMAATQLGPDIRVNAVCPGYVLPPEGFDKKYKEKLETRLPLGKVPTTKAVAEAVYMLVQNPTLTGQILYVDGGESLL